MSSTDKGILRCAALVAVLAVLTAAPGRVQAADAQALTAADLDAVTAGASVGLPYHLSAHPLSPISQIGAGASLGLGAPLGLAGAGGALGLGGLGGSLGGGAGIVGGLGFLGILLGGGEVSVSSSTSVMSN